MTPGQGVARISFADGTATERAILINAIVRAWDNAFFARQRGKVHEEKLKKDQEQTMKSLSKQQAELADLNREPIPNDPGERQSLEGRKRVRVNFIRQTEEAIRRFTNLIEKDRENQLKLPIVMEWAKAP